MDGQLARLALQRLARGAQSQSLATLDPGKPAAQSLIRTNYQVTHGLIKRKNNACVGIYSVGYIQVMLCNSVIRKARDYIPEITHVNLDLGV